MKFDITQSVLEGMLASLQPFLDKKDNTNILSHILFTIRGDRLLLRASDGEFGLTVFSTEFSNATEGSFTCNGKKILDIIRALKDAPVTLQDDGDNVIVKQGRSRYKFQTLDSSSFPEFVEGADLKQIDIKPQQLITGLRKITPPIDTNSPKQELKGALVDVRLNTINIVSTDTKRLALFNIDQKSEKASLIILPKKAITEIQKIFTAEVSIFFDQTNFIMSNENYYFYTRLINGKYPDYERIIPRDLAYNFTLDTEKMIDALKQVSAMSVSVKISFASGEISIEMLEGAGEEASAGFEAEIEIEKPFTICVNSKFLLDFLSQCQEASFSISINEPSMPFIVKSESFSTVVMPIIL
ncbi:DNA polymerase III subunit beta [Campylobacterota bacterium]|nr:DNA polymerase III subunit beta [Campylobacterota bacterium]